MFGLLVTHALKNRMLVLAFAGVLMLYGAFAITRLPVDVLPDLDRPTVTIMTEAEGLAPPEVEQLVTLPIETQMNGLPGVTRVRSTSGVGLSIVYVEFDWNTEIYRNRQQITERLALARDRLPPNVTPQMGPISSIMGQVLMVALTGPDSVSPMEMREIAEFVIRPRLLTIPGVAQVIPMGGEVRQYRVSPNPAAMRALGVTFEQIERALTAFGTNTGGGFSDQDAREFLIRNVGRTLKLEDLSALVIGVSREVPIRLDQVAEVGYGARLKRGDAGFMGKPAVVLSVEKQPDIDTLKLTAELEAALRDLARTMPPGVKADNILFRQANFIETSIRNLKKVLIEAVAVVAIVLFLFLLNARTTIISLTAIPVSVLATAIAFHAMGLSINTMTLGGLAIAIGELVDDAVVDVENIFRRLRENRLAGNPRTVFDVVVSASQEVRSGIVYATAIIILVFVPLFALTGIEGRLFAPLGKAYVISILMSLVVSITLTPVMAYYMLPNLKRFEHGDTGLVLALKRWNAAMLGFVFRFSRVLILAIVLMVGGTIWMAFQLPRAFLPPFNEGTLTINTLFNPGISLVESQRIGLIAERLILEVPEVKQVGRRTGRAELDEHAEGVHSSEIEVELRPSSRTKEAVVADIRERLAVLPLVTNVGQPISHRLDHMLSGVRAQIALKVFGEDLDQLRRVAEELRGKIASIPGIVDLQVEKQVRIPHLDITIDYTRAALYGITPATITGQLERLSNGRVMSRLVDGTRRFDLVLRLDDHARTTATLAAMLIETPRGWVPLSALADVRETDGPNQILRENGKRRIVVLANSDGHTDMAAIIADIRKVVREQTLPSGAFAILEGTFQAQEEATRTLAILSLVSLAMIFALLYSRYRSVRLALIIMGSVPLALIGSVTALWLAGQPLSVASTIGFITLTGIAARNGILKVSHWINLAINEGMPFGRDLVIRGSLERLTPVLMTALSAGIALLPLMIDAHAPGKEILYPVAITIFGGLITATVLDMLLTPVLFLRFGATPVARLVETVRREATQASPSLPLREVY
jgi:heavy-metal exporter, HME family